MKKIYITLLLILSLSTISLVAQGTKENTTEADKTIVIASNCEWPPLEFVDKNGAMVGFEIDLINEIANETGYKFVIKNVSWDGIFAGLANGAYDGVASGVSVTEERKATLNFSTTYLKVTQAIICLSENNKPATTIKELAGKKVGVLIGSTGDIMLQDSGLDVKIMSYDSIALAVEDLLNGNLSAVVTDSVVAGEYVVSNKVFAGKLKVSGKSEDNVEPIAMCFKKGDSKTTDIINKGLKALEENGKLDELKVKWAIL
ncbi:MAG: transporter substrate-binding domain-containing protein [Spirochaetaceae bacterium]|nr:transporter substrate-binding domain-containing protein [Spirochaetaceae bacterium]